MQRWMGSVSAWFRSGRECVVAVLCALVLVSGCGRTELLPGDDGYPVKPGAGAGGQGGAGGRGQGGSAGRRPIDPMGGVGGGVAGGGAAGVAGMAGAGGQPNRSLFCDASQRAVLYLLSDQSALFRIDADTLEPLGEVQVGISGANSLAVTANGTVYATAGLALYQVDALSGQAVNVNLVVANLSGDFSLTIGYAPVDPVLFGDALLLAHADPTGEIDLYAVPLQSSFVPLWRHHFDDLDEYPEPLVDPTGRTFAMISEGFVEYDPGTLTKLGTLPVPGLPQAWSGDSAYLSGYLFAVYAESASSSRIYRAQVVANLGDSPINELGNLPIAVVGAGATCEERP